MANQITWRNIAAPDLQAASSPMLAAQAGFQDTFKQLGDVLQKAADGRVNTNTQAFKDMLAQYRTPEALQAAMDSGAIDTARAQFGNTIDRNVAREAPRQNLEAAMTNRLEDQQFGAQQKAIADAPIAEQIKVLAATGRHDEANALIRANPGLTGLGALAGDARKFSQGDTRFTSEVARDAANLTGTNLNNESKVLQIASDTIDGQVKQQAQKDATAKRNIETAITNASVDGMRSRDNTERSLGTESQRLGLPVTPDGLPDRAAIAADPALLKKWNDAGMGNVVGQEANDTARTAAALRKGVEDKRFSQDDANRALITGALGVDTRPVLRGTDKVLADNAKTLQANADAQFVENSFASPGTTDAQRNAVELADYATKMIPNGEERSAVLQKISELASKGVKVRVGNEDVMINPPMQVMKNMINQSRDTAWFFGQERGDNLEKVVKEWAKNNQKELQIEWAKRKDVDNRRRLQGVSPTSTKN